VADIVTSSGDVTRTELIVNVALVDPWGTVTDNGVLAIRGKVLDSETTAPPTGAGPVSVTVPCEEVPPTIVSGFKLRDDNTIVTGTGLTVREAVRVTLL
jgi:hypothetical protein